MAGDIRAFQDGIQTNPPLNWQELTINVLFGDSAQGSIEIDNVSLVNESAQRYFDYIQRGLIGGNGIFEGQPYKLEIFNKDNVSNLFDGYIDGTENLKIIEPTFGDRTLPVEIQTSLKEFSSYLTYQDRLSGISMLLLEQEGVFTDADYQLIPYVVEKEVNVVEVAIIFITITSIIFQIITIFKDTVETVANTIAHTTGGLSGLVASAIYIAFILALNGIIILALLFALINQINELISLFFSLVREYKGIKLKTLIQKVVEYTGYKFETDIEELDYYYYLPSKPRGAKGSAAGLSFLQPKSNTSVSGNFPPPLNFFSSLFPELPDTSNIINKYPQIDTGLPREQDRGYIADELVSLLNDLFYADIAILDGTVHLRALKSDWWTKQSDYTMKSKLFPTLSFNTDELIGTRFFRFAFDINDTFTNTDFKGNTYQVATLPRKVSDERAQRIRGFEEKDFGVALASRKSELTDFEEALEELIKSFGIISGATKYNLT